MYYDNAGLRVDETCTKVGAWKEAGWQPRHSVQSTTRWSRQRLRGLWTPAPEMVIVFGSAARGETAPGSDLDLLVVLDLPEGITARHGTQAPRPV